MVFPLIIKDSGDIWTTCMTSLMLPGNLSRWIDSSPPAFHYKKYMHVSIPLDGGWIVSITIPLNPPYMKDKCNTVIPL